MNILVLISYKYVVIFSTSIKIKIITNYIEEEKRLRKVVTRKQSK